MDNNEHWKRDQFWWPRLSFPAKQYKVSRRCVLVYTFAREAIRRRMFQDLLFPSNNVLALEMDTGILIITIHPALPRLTQLQALSSNTECSDGT